MATPEERLRERIRRRTKPRLGLQAGIGVAQAAGRLAAGVPKLVGAITPRMLTTGLIPDERPVVPQAAKLGEAIDRARLTLAEAYPPRGRGEELARMGGEIGGELSLIGAAGGLRFGLAGLVRGAAADIGIEAGARPEESMVGAGGALLQAFAKSERAQALGRRLSRIAESPFGRAAVGAIPGLALGGAAEAAEVAPAAIRTAARTAIAAPGGAVIGGTIGAAASPEDRARGAAIGATLGAGVLAGLPLLSRMGRRGTLGGIDAELEAYRELARTRTLPEAQEALRGEMRVLRERDPLMAEVMGVRTDEGLEALVDRLQDPAVRPSEAGSIPLLRRGLPEGVAVFRSQGPGPEITMLVTRNTYAEAGIQRPWRVTAFMDREPIWHEDAATAMHAHELAEGYHPGVDLLSSLLAASDEYDEIAFQLEGRGRRGGTMVRLSEEEAEEVVFGVRPSPEEMAARQAEDALVEEVPAFEPYLRDIVSEGDAREGLGLPREGYVPNPDIAAALEERARKTLGDRRLLDDPTPDNRRLLGRMILEELSTVFRRNPKAREIATWYRDRISHAMRVASRLFPELRQDAIARSRYRFALAVTSSGMEVQANARLAEAQYRYYVENGRFATEGLLPGGVEAVQGNQRIGMQKAFETYNQLVDHMGPDRTHAFLNTDWTVSDLTKMGFTVDAYGADDVVSGSAIFGPKIGAAFFQNLEGRWDIATFDRWFMRTVGRLSGTLRFSPEEIASALTSYQAKIGRKDLTLEEAIADAGVHYEANERAYAEWRKAVTAADEQGLPRPAEPDKSDAQKAAQAFLGVVNGIKVDSGPSKLRLEQVRHLRQAMADALNAFNYRHGTEMDLASAQAMLWYPEQDLWAKLGSRAGTRPPTDFGLATEEVLRAARQREGIPAERIRREISNVRRQTRRATQRASESALDAGGGQRYRSLGDKERVEWFRQRVGVVGRERDPFASKSFRAIKSTGRAATYRLAGATGPVLNRFRAHGWDRNVYKAGGVGTPDIIEIAEGEVFERAITRAMGDHPVGGAVHIYSPEDYNSMRLFLTEDGEAGFALRGGDDIVSVFKRPRSEGKQGFSLYALRLAVQQGGRRLDAFDTELPRLYALAGFQPTSRLPFNAEIFASDYGARALRSFQRATRGYNKGSPDVVAMVYQPSSNGRYLPGSGLSTTSYDEFLDAQQRGLRGEFGALDPRLGTYLVGPTAGAAVGAALAPEGERAKGAAAGALAGLGAAAAISHGAGPRIARMAREAQARRKAGTLTIGDRELDELAGIVTDEQTMRGISKAEAVGPEVALEDVTKEVPFHTFALDPQGEARLRRWEVNYEKKTITWDEQKAVARQLGLRPEDILKKRARDLTAGETLAIRDIVRTNVEEIERLTDLKRRAEIGDGDALDSLHKMGVQDPEDLVGKIELIEGQNDALLNKFVRVRSEYGRMLNSLKILAETLPLTMENRATWFAKAQRILGESGKLTDEMRAEITRLINEGNKQELVKYVGSLRKAGKVEKFITFWKAGLLTSPTTHAANIFGNTTMAMLETAKDAPAFMLDRLASTLSGLETKSLPGLRVQRASVTGARKGVGEVAQAFRTGTSLQDASSRWDVMRQVNFDNVILDTYTKAVFQTLEAEDRIFRSAALTRSLADQAGALARNEGHRGAALRKRVDELMLGPTDEMVARAIEDSEVATFRNRGVTARVFTGLGKALDEIPYVPVGQILLPFRKTPANIAARALEYSPFGYLGAVPDVIRFFDSVAKGTPNFDVQRRMVERLGRATTGTSVPLTIGWFLAANDLITTSYPVSPNERAAWARDGKQQNSVLINGKWRSLERISPFGNLIIMGAHLHNVSTQSKLSFDDALLSTGVQALRTVAETGPVSGIQGAIELLPGQGFGEPEKRMQRYIQYQARGVAPSLLRRIAEGTDPYARSTRVTGPTIVQVGKAIQQAIPGVRQHGIPFLGVEGLPAAVDPTFGEPRRQTGGLYSRVVDPFASRPSEIGRRGIPLPAPSGAREDPVRAELARRNIHVPTVGRDPGSTEKQYLQKRIMYGRATREAVVQAFADDKYRNAKTDIERGRIVRDYVTKARRKLTDELKQRRPAPEPGALRERMRR